MGLYLWTGADYLGEADAWPNVIATFGLIDRVGTIKSIGYSYQSVWSTTKTTPPATATSGAAKIVVTVDHPQITTDWDDVAYIKATVTNASGVQVSNAGNAITFSVSGTAGKIIGVDSGIKTGETYTRYVRNAFEGVCYAIIQMTTAGSIAVSASAPGLTGSSVTVSGSGDTFVPCSGSCD